MSPKHYIFIIYREFIGIKGSYLTSSIPCNSFNSLFFGSGLPCPNARSGSPWVGVALSECSEWVSLGRGCLVRMLGMGLPGSGLPCPNARRGSPWVGVALSECSEGASLGRGCPVRMLGGGSPWVGVALSECSEWSSPGRGWGLADFRQGVLCEESVPAN